MPDLWTTRDLPVLDSIVRALAEDPFRGVTPEHVSAATGLSQGEVASALTNLASARPPFFDGISIEEVPFPITITSVSERALRTTGTWPEPEQLVMRLISALEEAASQEPDPDKRSRLDQAAKTLGGIALQVVIGWASGAIPHP